MEDFKIVAKSSLKNNPVVDILSELGTEVRYLSLKQGEFILPSSIGVRYLSDKQFEEMVHKRTIYREIVELRKEYERPVVLLEGENLFSDVGRDVTLFQGAILYISIANHIPILASHNALESAQILFMLTGQIYTAGIQDPGSAKVKDKKSKGKGKNSDHSDASPLTLVQMIPEIEPALAQTLLEHFKSLAALFSASINQLKKIEGIGPKRAMKIYKFFNAHKAA